MIIQLRVEVRYPNAHHEWLLRGLIPKGRKSVFAEHYSVSSDQLFVPENKGGTNISTSASIRLRQPALGLGTGRARWGVVSGK